ncbi:hypothetical protein F5148DRAFT_1291458 [Russula earlei]|uniref:Uncharacterized protein n=1 Tax=Russula earlei TaxID=71964 RepID=A0ACC0TWN6_9AGAM|nr:hypothetical protein F5148DRAFT_1291458 [Russula earlei]
MAAHCAPLVQYNGLGPQHDVFFSFADLAAVDTDDATRNAVTQAKLPYSILEINLELPSNRWVCIQPRPSPDLPEHVVGTATWDSFHTFLCYVTVENNEELPVEFINNQLLRNSLGLGYWRDNDPLYKPPSESEASSTEGNPPEPENTVETQTSFESPALEPEDPLGTQEPIETLEIEPQNPPEPNMAAQPQIAVQPPQMAAQAPQMAAQAPPVIRSTPSSSCSSTTRH